VILAALDLGHLISKIDPLWHHSIIPIARSELATLAEAACEQNAGRVDKGCMIGATIDLYNVLLLHQSWGRHDLVSRDLDRNPTLAILVAAPSIALPSGVENHRVIVAALDLDRVFIHHAFDQHGRVLVLDHQIPNAKLAILVGAHRVHQIAR
jgi:hypothetical protein